MRDPAELLHRIKMYVLRSLRWALPTADVSRARTCRLTGVLEVGIFAGMALAAYFGNPDGTVTVRWQDGKLSLSRFDSFFVIHELTRSRDLLFSLSGRRHIIEAPKK
jgi:hypothetical protein